ncbi:recombinase family protein [Rhodococcus sp. ARC_M6]|uniref:recombinase family protein n=1 Tax=Rhodococcus sp. ARC_M6 TaxID=2928852 RepID=UPI001FB54F7F|nr:recombinase family protein [Rhodococcus sp. ARC_M6]MCJ0906247.1 recombinase family protein [Rhodococcus sp. ARC_M6]
MRALVYCRISADREGSGLGVDRQREDCEALAQTLGWEVVEVFTDNDLSAYSGKPRPAYMAMLEALQRGRAGAVIAWHTDRLHRSPVELESFISLCEPLSIVVRTVQAGEIDLSTPAGQMNARIVGAVARHEIDHARKRMVRAHEQAASSGQWRARRQVFGYAKDGATTVEVEAQAIRAAATDVLSGKSLRQVAREWNEAGHVSKGSAPKWNASSIRRILANPRYASLQEYRGRIVGDGNWPRIIERDEHHALLALFADPKRSSRLGSERKHQGSGVYQCGLCESRMTMTFNAGGSMHYRCTQSAHLSRQGEALDAWIDEVVLGRLSMPDAKLMLDVRDRDLPALQTERDGLQSRMDQLAGMFAEGAIDGSQLRRGTEDLRVKVAKLDDELADARSVSPLADLILAGDELRSRWDAMSADLRGQVIASLIDVVVLKSPRGLRRFEPEYVQITWRK